MSKPRPLTPVAKTDTKPLPASRPEVQPDDDTAEFSTGGDSVSRVNEHPGQSIVIDLGVESLLGVAKSAYCSAHAQIEMTQKARLAAKRLNLTLNQMGARLSDGSIVNSSVPKTIVWLLERVADAVADSPAED